MTVGGTTIGPVTEQTRDRVADYRDSKGLPNYEAALQSLLNKNQDIEK